ncbi:MAG: DMT family transporter [Geminicoccaceae bacterium]
MAARIFMERPYSERSNRLKGVALIVAGVSLFAGLDAAGKALAEQLSVVQVVWSRYAFAVPVVLLTTPPAMWRRLFSVQRPLVQAVRGLLPVIASFSIVAGLGLLPLAEITALTFASPFLVVALSAPLLRERTSIHDWIGVVLGFIGILVIVRPGLNALAWAAIFPLGCAFAFALFQLATRFVGRSDSPTATFAWTIAVGLAVTTPLLLVEWRPVTPWLLFLMAVSGLCFGFAQYLLIRAFAIAPVALLTPFSYSQIVPAVIFGYIFWGSVPDLWTILGGGIVIAAGLYVLRWRVGRA